MAPGWVFAATDIDPYRHPTRGVRGARRRRRQALDCLGVAARLSLHDRASAFLKSGEFQTSRVSQRYQFHNFDFSLRIYDLVHLLVVRLAIHRSLPPAIRLE
jgi:hypothetical protein